LEDLATLEAMKPHASTTRDADKNPQLEKP
jgi:hypothetical protein